LSEESRWLNGPAFLRRPAASWPGSAPSDEANADDEEQMPSELHVIVEDCSLGPKVHASMPWTTR